MCDSLEAQLPVDLCIVALYDEVQGRLALSCAGARSADAVDRLGLRRTDSLSTGDDAVRRCLGGALVHAAASAADVSPLVRRLRAEGFASAVLAPLRVDERSFGLVIAARRTGQGFSAAD